MAKKQYFWENSENMPHSRRLVLLLQPPAFDVEFWLRTRWRAFFAKASKLLVCYGPGKYLWTFKHLQI